MEKLLFSNLTSHIFPFIPPHLNPPVQTAKLPLSFKGAGSLNGIINLFLNNFSLKSLFLILKNFDGLNSEMILNF